MKTLLKTNCSARTSCLSVAKLHGVLSQNIDFNPKVNSSRLLKMFLSFNQDKNTRFGVHSFAKIQNRIIAGDYTDSFLQKKQKIRKWINRGLIPTKETKNAKRDFSIYTACNCFSVKTAYHMHFFRVLSQRNIKVVNPKNPYQTLLCRFEGLGREAVQAEQPGFVIDGTGTETIYQQTKWQTWLFSIWLSFDIVRFA